MTTQTKKQQKDIQEEAPVTVDARAAEVEEWKTKYLRALADYQNLDKRTRSEKEEIWKFAAERMLARLFPVIDTFEKAKEHLKDQGLDLVWKELQAVLSEQGVEKIETVGKVFDPHEMECIEVVEGKKDIVVMELRPGYRLHDKVLQVAQVKVGGKKISE